jgi:hypothetical protein
MQSCIHECGKSLQAWTALAVHSQAVQVKKHQLAFAYDVLIFSW